MGGIFAAVIPAVIQIIGKVITNKADAAAVQAKILTMQAEGALKQIENDFNLAIAQVEVNKAEATSNNLFVAGWRPFAGWVSVLLFALAAFGVLDAVHVLISHGLELAGLPHAIPNINTSDLLYGMLGFGGFRTYEKVKGIGSK